MRNMRPIIHSTELLDTRHDELLTMGQRLDLTAGDTADEVEVWAEVTRRGLFRRRQQRVCVGRLDSIAARQIHGGIRAGASYRVRLVELIPPHLRAAGASGVIISVWGDVDPGALQHPA